MGEDVVRIHLRNAGRDFDGLVEFACVLQRTGKGVHGVGESGVVLEGFAERGYGFRLLIVGEQIEGGVVEVLGALVQLFRGEEVHAVLKLAEGNGVEGL